MQIVQPMPNFLPSYLITDAIKPFVALIIMLILIIMFLKSTSRFTYKTRLYALVGIKQYDMIIESTNNTNSK